MTEAVLRYRISDLTLDFFETKPGAVELLRPHLDMVSRIFEAAGHEHVKPGVYDVVLGVTLVLKKPVTTRSLPIAGLVGAALVPGDRTWDQVHPSLPQAIRTAVRGPFVAVSVNAIVTLWETIGLEGAMVDFSETLYHEMIHLSTGVRHSGNWRKDICLQAAERFIEAAVRVVPVSKTALRVFRRVEYERRRTGFG